MTLQSFNTSPFMYRTMLPTERSGSDWFMNRSIKQQHSTTLKKTLPFACVLYKLRIFSKRLFHSCRILFLFCGKIHVVIVKLQNRLCCLLFLAPTKQSCNTETAMLNKNGSVPFIFENFRFETLR